MPLKNMPSFDEPQVMHSKTKCPHCGGRMYHQYCVSLRDYDRCRDCLAFVRRTDLEVQRKAEQ